MTLTFKEQIQQHDFSIEVEVSNDTSKLLQARAHLGPDIDDIELNILHNEVTTDNSNTVAASTSSSYSNQQSATTVSAVVAEVD